MTKERLDNDEDLKSQVNEKLAEVGLEYKGTSSVRHFLYAIIDDYGLDKLAEKVERPLNDFNVAAFYGCHNIRPSHLHNKQNAVNENASEENPYNPSSLDRLIEALQGKSVDYESKNKCCGFHADLQAPKTANRLTGTALLDAIDNDADMMVTPCPLCHLNMDVKQHAAAKEMGRDIELPVLHLPQLIGLALGIDPEELGIKHNVAEVNFV